MQDALKLIIDQENKKFEIIEFRKVVLDTYGQMQSVASILNDQQRVGRVRLGQIALLSGFDEINFTHPSVIGFIRLLQDVYITFDCCLT